VLAFAGTEGSLTGSLLPTGNVRDSIAGIDVTCVDNGMPVVLAAAESFGLTGTESVEELAADTRLLDAIDALRIKAGALMGLRDVATAPVPKTVLISPPTDGGDVCTRSFIPRQPLAAVGVLAAVSAVTAMRVPGAIGYGIARGWATGPRQVDVEHPTGHILVDVALDMTGARPRVGRAGVVRTARKLSEGTVFPR
jgi:4-oxalomesaconate tautomerase